MSAPTHPPAPPAASPDSSSADDDLADILRRINDDVDPVAAPVVGTAVTRPTDVERPERASAAVIESEGGIDFHPEFASFAARAVGLLIDVAFLLVLELPAIALLARGSGVLALVGIVFGVAGFIVAAALYARAVARTGQSMGNRVASTTVVDARNGRTITAAAAATRYVIRMFPPTMLLGFFMALANADRRTFHDQFAGTVVVRPPRASWSIDDDPAGSSL